MSYLNKYEYQFDGDTLESLNHEMCFWRLFGNLSNSKKTLFNLDFKIYMFKYTHQSICHELQFTKDDIEYVFNRLSHVIDIPVIEEITDKINGDGLSLSFNFKQKTKGHIRVAITLCRYFYEKYNPTNNINFGFKKRCLYHIMKDSIDYSKENPDEPFIEILQFMHHSSDTNGGHTIVNVSTECVPVAIVSDSTFVAEMKNPLKFKCYESYDAGGVFIGYKLDRYKGNTEDYLKTFKTITRI